MYFIEHYSSSKGNFYEIVANNHKRILLDPGVTWQMAEKALNYDLSNIVGCMVTHSHSDHCRCVRDVQKAGIKIYGSTGTLNVLDLEPNHKVYCINSKKKGWFSLWPDNTFRIMPCIANHDAKDPLFFVINCDNEYLLFAPDTAFIRQRFNLQFSIIAIECSFDIKVLQARVRANDINESLAKRFLSAHMEKSVAMKYISKYCDLSKCREIHLLHMSGDNIDAEQVQKEFEQKFFITTIVCGLKET